MFGFSHRNEGCLWLCGYVGTGFSRVGNIEGRCLNACVIIKISCGRNQGLSLLFSKVVSVKDVKWRVFVLDLKSVVEIEVVDVVVLVSGSMVIGIKDVDVLVDVFVEGSLVEGIKVFIVWVLVLVWGSVVEIKAVHLSVSVLLSSSVVGTKTVDL